MDDDFVFITKSYNSGEQLLSYNTKKMSHKHSISYIEKSIFSLNNNKLRKSIEICSCDKIANPRLAMYVI